MDATKGGSAFGFRQRLTTKLIEFMEENDGTPWEKGWVDMPTRPFNPRSGTRFRGGNVLTLMLAQMERGSSDPRWMTLRQANDAGLRIRSQAKGTYIEYWDWGQPQPPRKREVDAQGNPVARPDGEVSDDEEELEAVEKPKVRPKPFVSLMFNGEDVVGLPPLKREIDWEPHDLAERLIAATGARIEHTLVTRAGRGFHSNAAFYTHGADKIVMPPRESFPKAADYYATKLHELAHWTGHASRLARRAPDESQAFGSAEYAREELRAEIAAMFLNSMLGMDGKVQNHAKYTSNWLEVLKNDKHEIFRAARDAEKIVDHLFDYAPELREIVESTLSDNLLPQSAPKRGLDRTIKSDLPNFIPASEEISSPVGTGKDDPRWAGFAQAVKEQADKLGVEASVVERAMAMVEPSFSDVMNAAEGRGYTADDMKDMLARSIMDELRMADTRQQQWEKFCAQVRKAGEGKHAPERIELALADLGRDYQKLVLQGIEDKWPPEETDRRVRALIYGDTGPRKVTDEYVGWMLERSKSSEHVTQAQDDDDDFVLMPRGADRQEELPEDLGVAQDEPLDELMGDAQTHESNELA